MSFLLDTNVISEPTRRSPSPDVVAWLARRAPDEIFFSAVMLAEVRYGIDGAPTGARKRALEVWFGETFVSWPERIVPVSFEIAQAWGGPVFNPRP